MNATIELNITEAEMIKNTVLIAEFMGYEVIDYQHNKLAPIYNGNKYAKTVGELKTRGGLDLQFTGRFTENVRYPFNTDFNYLIPIIKRIEENGYGVRIDRISCTIYELFGENITSLVCGNLSKKTELTYHAIIKFIEWHNQNKD